MNKKGTGPRPCPEDVQFIAQDKAWKDAKALRLSLKRNKTENYFLPADPKPPQLGPLGPAGEPRAMCQAWLCW